VKGETWCVQKVRTTQFCSLCLRYLLSCLRLSVCFAPIAPSDFVRPLRLLLYLFAPFDLYLCVPCLFFSESSVQPTSPYRFCRSLVFIRPCFAALKLSFKSSEHHLIPSLLCFLKPSEDVLRTECATSNWLYSFLATSWGTVVPSR